MWATPFQPPSFGIVGSPAGNAINWLVRPKTYCVEVDGQWFDTEFGYGFNHSLVDQFTGSPSATIARPTWLEQVPRGGVVRYRQDMDYLNRGRTDGECHEYLGDTPYARGLPSSSQTSLHGTQGTLDVLAKTTSQYDDAQLPFPTRRHQWASANEAIASTYDYYTSGPHAGKLQREYAGPEPATATVFEDYIFGIAKTIRTPLLPATEHLIDFRGDVRTTTETGVTTEFEYDLSDRVVRTKQPTMLDAVTEYSPPGTLNPETTAYYEDGSAARKWTHTVADGWNRPVTTESDVTAALSGRAEIQYNALGQAEKKIAPSGSWETTSYDVYGRAVSVETYDAGGGLVQRSSFDYDSFIDGTSKVVETITRDGKTTVRTTLTDFAGRVIEAGINEGRPGPGGALGSDDYAGGGVTRFRYEHDLVTGLTTVTTMPYGLEDGSQRVEVRDMLGRSVLRQRSGDRRYDALQLRRSQSARLCHPPRRQEIQVRTRRRRPPNGTAPADPGLAGTLRPGRAAQQLSPGPRLPGDAGPQAGHGHHARGPHRGRARRPGSAHESGHSTAGTAVLASGACTRAGNNAFRRAGMAL